MEFMFLILAKACAAAITARVVGAARAVWDSSAQRRSSRHLEPKAGMSIRSRVVRRASVLGSPTRRALLRQLYVLSSSWIVRGAPPVAGTGTGMLLRVLKLAPRLATSSAMECASLRHS